MVGRDGIRVWTVALDTIPETLWPRLIGLLDGTEQEHAKRFRSDRHRRQYQAAHAMKRLMLAAATAGATAPEAWTFATGAHGKPYVVPGEGPRFNLSHCDGLVACAVSRRTELGIDVETMDRKAALDLAKGYFAPTEEAWLQSLDPAAQHQGFFQLWTLKEAFIKATGLGLAQPLDAFSFRFDPLGIAFRDPALGDPAAWHFAQCAVGAQHQLALAWRTDADEVAVEIAAVRLETIMRGTT